MFCSLVNNSKIQEIKIKNIHYLSSKVQIFMPKIYFSTYQSPFAWRYGSDKMRRIWSEENKVRLWRRVWLALAQAQYQAGLLSKAEITDLQKYVDDFNVGRILEIEKTTRHDLMAGVKEYAEKAKIGGGKIHLGATSDDIIDNADILRIKQALEIIKQQLKSLLTEFAKKIDQYAEIPTLGYTHLQPAVPTTVGYRLAFYAQDLFGNYGKLEWVMENLRSKGFKGVVGSSISYEQLLNGGKISAQKMEQIALRDLGLAAFPISIQTYPRQQDYQVVSLLAQIAASLYKFAADLRILQSPLFGEWQEEFGKTQVGSSAMPHKKNPVMAENVCSHARWITMQPQVMLENSMHSYLERTLDDSANRRLVMPDTFLATDHILNSAQKLVTKLEIRLSRVKFNLEQYAPFIATEPIILAAVKHGASRQETHEELRKLAVAAWIKVEQGLSNPLNQMYLQNKFLLKYLTKTEMENLLNTKPILKTAIDACQKLVQAIKKITK